MAKDGETIVFVEVKARNGRGKSPRSPPIAVRPQVKFFNLRANSAGRVRRICVKAIVSDQYCEHNLADETGRSSDLQVSRLPFAAINSAGAAGKSIAESLEEE